MDEMRSSVQTTHGFTTSQDNVALVNQPKSVAKYPDPGSTKGSDEKYWMPTPQGVPLCPPGLEYLSLIDKVLIHQKVIASAMICDCQSRNFYDFQNSLGQTIYVSEEDVDSWNRCCWGTWRPFDLRIKDYTRREVISLCREVKCDCCCCPCCLQEMDVFSPPGTLVGRVIQEWSMFKPQYRVENEHGEKIFQITGPLCIVPCLGVDFKVFARNDAEIGKITKEWTGHIYNGSFGITFPLDLDVKMKAILMGACILIDFNYFERDFEEWQNR